MRENLQRLRTVHGDNTEMSKARVAELEAARADMEAETELLREQSEVMSRRQAEMETDHAAELVAAEERAAELAAEVQ